MPRRRNNLRVFNDRIKLTDDNSGITRFVRIDDDGDTWIETEDHEKCIYFPKTMALAVANAVKRAQEF